jgi:HSP20 family protein
MNYNDRFQYDNMFNSFFNLDGLRRGSSLFDTIDLFRDFDNLHREMNRMFNVFNDLSANAPKESIKEYQTQDNGKVHEVGPIVYEYSITIGPDGKPRVSEFRDVKSNTITNMRQILGNHSTSSKTEVLSDVTITNKEVKVVLEMPGIKDEDIKIDTYDKKLEVKTANRSTRKYHKIVDLPKEADTETTRFRYNNGILEITFDIKSNIKTKAKDALVHWRNVFPNTSSRILDFKNKMKHFKKNEMNLIYNILLKLKNLL